MIFFFKDRRPHFFCTAPGLIILRADPSPITTQKIKISECDFFGENISDPYFFLTKVSDWYYECFRNLLTFKSNYLFSFFKKKNLIFSLSFFSLAIGWISYTHLQNGKNASTNINILFIYFTVNILFFGHDSI